MKKNKNIKNIVVLVPLIGVLGWLLMPSDEGNSENLLGKSSVTAPEPAQNQYANVPDRFNAAPDYNEGVMAAKILKQASDPDEALSFVPLKVSERVLKLQVSIAEKRAKIAKSNLTTVTSDTKAGKIEGTGNVTQSFSYANEYPSGDNEHNQSNSSISGDGNYLDSQIRKQSDAIRIVGWSSTGNITASLNGKEFAPRIRVNQVLWGRYMIKAIDPELKCLTLTDERVGKPIPDVCYN